MSDTSPKIQITVPDVVVKLSDDAAIKVSEIHAQSWPGLINGVLRNLNSEASRAVINRIHKDLTGTGEFIADTKANRDAGKSPTTKEEAKAMRKAWKEAHPAEYDAYMAEAEKELLATVRDGTFRVHEPAGPRASSLSPEESRARDIGRAEFDDVVLVKAGYEMPKTKAGNRFAPNSKQLAKLEIKTKNGVKLYPDALEAFYAKSKDRFLADAKRQLDAERKRAEKALGEAGDALDI